MQTSADDLKLWPRGRAHASSHEPTVPPPGPKSGFRPPSHTLNQPKRVVNFDKLWLLHLRQVQDRGAFIPTRVCDMSAGLARGLQTSCSLFCAGSAGLRNLQSVTSSCVAGLPLLLQPFTSLRGFSSAAPSTQHLRDFAIIGDDRAVRSAHASKCLCRSYLPFTSESNPIHE